METTNVLAKTIICCMSKKQDALMEIVQNVQSVKEGLFLLLIRVRDLWWSKSKPKIRIKLTGMALL